jgi:D-amino-acid dehydrogenase
MGSEVRPIPEHSDVLIVGGGVIGAWTAWFLAERSASVVLVERDEVASGCSGGNAGWVLPSHSLPIPRPGILREAFRELASNRGRRARAGEVSALYIRPRFDLRLLRWLRHFLASCSETQMRRALALRYELSLHSQRLYEEVAAHSNLELPYEQRGLLLVCRSPDTLARARDELRLVEELGANGRLLDEEELAAAVPVLAPGTAGAVYYPDDAHLDPGASVVSVARGAQERGVRIETGTEVLRIERSEDRVVGVTTTRGSIRCEQLVLAGGSWSPCLLDPLGVRLPVEAARGYSVTVECPVPIAETPMLLCDANVAVTPMGGRLRFAGAFELAGLDLSVDLRRVEGILAGARSHLPGLGPLQPRQLWRGLRPLSPDDLPLVGRLRELPNLIVATGHGMKGMCQGPATGELAAQLVAGETPSLDPTPFSPDRFLGSRAAAFYVGPTVKPQR